MTPMIVEHPLLQHKISLLRNKQTGTKEFRDLVGEIATLLCYEATRDLPLEEVEIETPITMAKTKVLAGRKLALVPILRAGMGMLDGMLTLLPAAKVGFIGLYRNEETLQPVEYFCKLPQDIAERDVLVLDPMLATGGSAIDAITQIKKHGAKRIKFIGLIAAPEGIEALHKAHPDVDIYLGAKDDHLNENGYIVPGLGDAGDRISGTKSSQPNEKWLCSRAAQPFFCLSAAATAAAMERAAACVEAPAAKTAAGASAAHATKGTTAEAAAPTGRTRPAAARSGPARTTGAAGAPIIIRRSAPPSAAQAVAQPETEEGAKPAAAKAAPDAAEDGGQGKHHDHHRQKGEERRLIGCCRGLIVIISVVITIRIAVADRAGGPAQGHTVEIGNGAGHIVGTGGHSRVIIARRKGILHGLGNGAGLLFQRGIAEAVTGGKVIVAIGVLLGLHDQQDQHTVVFAGAAQPPGVGGLHGVILRG